MEAAAPAQRHRDDDSTAFALEQALSIVLNNPAMAADCQAVCILLEVCKGWHAIVQQSSGLLTAAKVPASLKCLASFAVWLLKWPGMVKSIKVTGIAENQQVAAALLQLGLRGATEAGATAAAAAQKDCSFWQLQSFQCFDTASTGVLLALPANTLTELILLDASPLGPTAQAAIGRLSQLRSLSLASEGIGFLATMTRLTGLHIQLCGDQPSLSQLPSQLQKLSLILDWRITEAAVIDLEQLTRLSSVELDVLSRPASVSLPTQLQEVQITTDQSGISAIESFGLAQLQQLRRINLIHHDTAIEPLQLLMGHTQLRVLSFKKKDDYLECLVPAWGLLQGLEELYLYTRFRSCMELSEFAGAISNCGTLTELQLDLICDPDGALAAADAPNTWEMLAGLTMLQDLTLDIWSKATARPIAVSLCSGISHLGKLTQLTCLSLNLGDELLHLPADMADFSWMLGRMTRLEYLSLRLGSSDAVGWDVALLPAVGQLSRLMHLDWPRLEEAPARRGVLFLTNLHRLTCLLGFEAAGAEALEKFWTCLRGCSLV